MFRYNQRIFYYFKNAKFINSFSSDKQHSTHLWIGTAGVLGRGNYCLLEFLTDKNKVIKKARFEAHACGVTIAIFAWLIEKIIDKKVSELINITAEQIIDFFDLPSAKYQCALLASQALNNAINNWHKN